MDIEVIRKIKLELLSDISGVDNTQTANREIPRQLSTEIRGLTNKKSLNMSIGYSVHPGSQSTNQGKLEIRIHQKRTTSKAYEAAEAVRNSLGEENVNIGFLEQAVVPKQFSADSTLKESPILGGRNRPLTLGCSVGHIDGGAGSIGGFLRDAIGNDYILSCNHVLALGNRANIGDTIINPGRLGNIMATAEDRIGELGDHVIFARRHANNSDSAICKLNSEIELLGNKIPDGIGAPNPGEMILPDTGEYPLSGQAVHKIGMLTGYTTGTLNAVSLDDVQVEMFMDIDGRGLRKEILKFDNVIEITHSNEEAFSKEGDSGSLVYYCTEDNKNLGLGIVFAGAVYKESPTGKPTPVTLCCTLKDVVRYYKDVNWV